MHKRRTFFTLVELLVVIAIIGILIGLGVGAVKSVDRAKRKALAKAQCRMILDACETYRETHGRLFVQGFDYNPITGNKLLTVTNMGPGQKADKGVPFVYTDLLTKVKMTQRDAFASGEKVPALIDENQFTFSDTGKDEEKSREDFATGGSSGSAISTSLMLLDPWGRSYRLVILQDYNAGPPTMTEFKYAIASLGPDEDENENGIGDGKVVLENGEVVFEDHAVGAYNQFSTQSGK